MNGEPTALQPSKITGGRHTQTACLELASFPFVCGIDLESLLTIDAIRFQIRRRYLCKYTTYLPIANHGPVPLPSSSIIIVIPCGQFPIDQVDETNKTTTTHNTRNMAPIATYDTIFGKPGPAADLPAPTLYPVKETKFEKPTPVQTDGREKALQQSEGSAAIVIDNGTFALNASSSVPNVFALPL